LLKVCIGYAPAAEIRAVVSTNRWNWKRTRVFCQQRVEFSHLPCGILILEAAQRGQQIFEPLFLHLLFRYGNFVIPQANHQRIPESEIVAGLQRATHTILTAPLFT
jgi:hypothetical protein